MAGVNQEMKALRDQREQAKVLVRRVMGKLRDVVKTTANLAEWMDEIEVEMEKLK